MLESSKGFSRKKVFGWIACVVFALAMVPAVGAVAANTSFSPYEYQVYASGTTFTNDYRAKTTSSYVGVSPSTTGYYVSPNAYIPQSSTAIHCGTRTYVNWSGYEKNISNYIYENGYNYAKLAFDAGGNGARWASGYWRPDNGIY